MCWLLQSALKTYYNVLFNLRFEELPLSTDPEISTPAVSREHEPFIIELPSLPCVSRVDNERISIAGVVVLAEIEVILLKATRLEEIKIRLLQKTGLKYEITENGRTETGGSKSSFRE